VVAKTAAKQQVEIVILKSIGILHFGKFQFVSFTNGEKLNLRFQIFLFTSVSDDEGGSIQQAKHCYGHCGNVMSVSFAPCQNSGRRVRI
jgi:hypothetical protein